MGDLPKLTWTRDVTGTVDNIHCNFTIEKKETIMLNRGGVLEDTF